MDDYQDFNQITNLLLANQLDHSFKWQIMAPNDMYFFMRFSPRFFFGCQIPDIFHRAPRLPPGVPALILKWVPFFIMGGKNNTEMTHHLMQFMTPRWFFCGFSCGCQVFKPWFYHIMTSWCFLVATFASLKTHLARPRQTTTLGNHIFCDDLTAEKKSPEPRHRCHHIKVWTKNRFSHQPEKDSFINASNSRKMKW